MTLADKLTLYRKEKGIKLDELVTLSGIPKGTLSKISSGLTTKPSIETMRAIAYALDKTLDDFTDPVPVADVLLTALEKELPEDEAEVLLMYKSLTDRGKDFIKDVLNYAVTKDDFKSIV